jgi:hypothetical protein
MPLNRHVNEPRDSSVYGRATIQAIRQAGDGTPAHASATWGSITGALNSQLDLKQRTDDLEALAFFEGE